MKDNDKINEENDFGEEKVKIVPLISLETKILARGISPEEINQFRQEAVEGYRVRRRSKNIIIIFILFVALVAFTAFFVIKDNMEKKQYQLFETENRKKVMVRDLNYYRDEFKEDPIERDFAWDSELPWLVIKDRQKIMDREVDEIWYTFSELDDKIEEEGKPSGNSIRMRTIYNSFEKLSESDIDVTIMQDGEHYSMLGYNFSIYKEKEKDFALYLKSYDSFFKVEIGEDKIEEEVLTEDINLPFSESKEENLFTLNLSVGYVCVKKDGHTIRLYRKGIFIGETKLQDKITDSIDGKWLYSRTSRKIYIPYMAATAKDKKFLIKEVAVLDFSKLDTNSYYHSDYCKEYSFLKS